MSKGNVGEKEKTKEIPAGEHKKASADHKGPTEHKGPAEHKGPTDHKGPAEHKKHEGPAAKGKNALAGMGGCVANGCKASSTRFNFCEEHFEHFKFGLIKKTGEPVSDYEKKFGHYTAHKAKQKSAKKVA